MKTIIGVALTALTPALLHASTLLGDTVQIRRELPSEGFLTGPFSTTVVAGSSDSVSVSGGNNMSINVEAASIIFNFGPSGGDGGGFSDHRIVISDIDWFGEPTLTLQSISATSDIAGFSPSFATFTDDTVSLAVGSFVWSGGQSVLVQLTPTPEPTTSVLLVLGIGSLLCKRKRRKGPAMRCSEST